MDWFVPVLAIVIEFKVALLARVQGIISLCSFIYIYILYTYPTGGSYPAIGHSNRLSSLMF